MHDARSNRQPTSDSSNRAASLGTFFGGGKSKGDPSTIDVDIHELDEESIPETDSSARTSPGQRLVFRVKRPIALECTHRYQPARGRRDQANEEPEFRHPGDIRFERIALSVMEQGTAGQRFRLSFDLRSDPFTTREPDRESLGQVRKF